MRYASLRTARGRLGPPDGRPRRAAVREGAFDRLESRALLSVDLSAPDAAEVESQVAAAAPPTIGVFTATPATVPTNRVVTLSAQNVSASAVSVQFFQETNGVAGLQLGANGDALKRTSAVQGGAAVGNTYAPAAPGTYRYYAAAFDGAGRSSALGTAAPSASVAAYSMPLMQPGKADGGTRLSINYDVVDYAVAPFSIQVYRSRSNTPGPGDTVLTTLSISDPADLSPGSHTKAYTIGGGPGQVPLPGLGAAEVDEDYQIVCAATMPDGATSVRGVSGAYHEPGGAVYLLGEGYVDDVTIDPMRVRLALNGWMFEYAPADVSGIHVRTGQNNDTIHVLGGGVIPVAIWGSEHDVLVSGPSNVTFDGGGGASVVLTGAAGAADLAELYPTSATLMGPSYAIAVSRVTTSVVNGEWSDLVTMHDSPGADGLIFQAGRVDLGMAGASESAVGFGSVTVIASNDTDTALAWGDSINGCVGRSSVLGPGYQLDLMGFHSVQVWLTGGPGRTAVLTGGSGDDVLVARSGGNSTFTSAAAGSRPWYYFVGNAANLYVYAGAGGIDSANIKGNTEDDQLHVEPAYASMTCVIRGERMVQYAAGFRVVAATGGGGSDRADLLGGAGDDVLLVGPTESSLSTGAGDSYHYFSAVGFSEVAGIARPGGNDSAVFRGSAGIDRFWGSPGYSDMRGAGYWNQANGFPTVTAYGYGGDDTAVLTDTALDGFYYGYGAVGQLSTSGGLFIDVEGFAKVSLTGMAGGSNRLKVKPLDYQLVCDGNWLQL